LKGQVDASLNRTDGDGHLSQLRYRISSRILSQVDDLVEKVESNRYDAALYDTLRALVAVYGDFDPISVRQADDHGALNIEVRSNPGLEGQVFTENSYAKHTPIMSAKHGKRSTFNGPHLN